MSISISETNTLGLPDKQLAHANDVRVLTNINLGDLGLFRGQPYPHQNVGTAWLYVIERAILADSVGLGKTIQGLMLAAMVLKRHPDQGSIVIITPGRLQNQWRDETFRFLGIKPTVFRDLAPSRRQYAVSMQPKILLIHYELLVRYPNILDRLAGISLVILDEAAAIKSHSAKTAKVCKILTTRAKRIVAMTATPIETSLADIHSIAETLHYRFLPQWSDFKAAFVNVQQFSGVKFGRYYDFEKIMGYRNLPQALALLSPIILRRTADDINVDLPPIVPVYQYLDFEPDHWAHYTKERANLRESIGGAPLEQKLQVIVDAVHVKGKLFSPKLDYVVENLKGDLYGKKAIIYASHIDTLRQIAAKLQSVGISCAVLYGNVSFDDRTKIQNYFNTQPNPQVIIADDVIKNGLNLPAAKHFFIFDTPRNPGKLMQILGRAQRIDASSDTIFAHLLFMDGSHENEILDIVNFRQALSDYMIGDYNESIFPKLSDAELLRVLKGSKR